MSALVDTEGRKVVVNPDGSLSVILESSSGTTEISRTAAALSTNQYLQILINQVILTNRILVASGRDRGTNFSDEILSALNKQVI